VVLKIILKEIKKLEDIVLSCFIANLEIENISRKIKIS